jgi:hypothetical protein
MALMDNFWLFMLSLLAMTPGGGSAFHTDLLAVVLSDSYLQAQQVDTKPESLLAVVKRSPSSPRELATQLVAIRWFGENADQLGDKRPAVSEALQGLAKGPPGFARDYALFALARLDGKTPPALHIMPKDSTRSQAFEWFPDDVSFVAALDLRAAPGQKEADAETVLAVNRIRNKFLTVIPGNALPGIHGIVSDLGNVRVDRVAFGYSPDPTGQRRDRLFVRITGQGDAKHVAEFIKSKGQQANLEERKGPNGVAMRVLTQPRMPIFAFIGDTDLVICGYEDDNANHAEVFDQFLSVLSGKRGSAAKGPYAQVLKTATEDARAVLVGSLPEELRKELARSPLGVAPLSLFADLSHAKSGGGVEVRVRASFDNEADAKKGAEGAKATLKQLADGLAALPFKLKPETVATLQKALGEAQISVEGASASGSVRLSPTTLKAVGELIEAASADRP